MGTRETFGNFGEELFCDKVIDHDTDGNEILCENSNPEEYTFYGEIVRPAVYEVINGTLTLVDDYGCESAYIEQVECQRCGQRQYTGKVDLW